MISSDPSVEGDTPFKSSMSPNEMFTQDITNEPKSSIVTNILEQINFDTWKAIDGTYEQLKNNNDQHQDPTQEQDKKPKSGHRHQPTDQGVQNQFQNAFKAFIQFLLQCLN